MAGGMAAHGSGMAMGMGMGMEGSTGSIALLW